MIMRGGIGDAETQAHFVDEQGLGQVEAHGPEVVARGEHDLVATRFERGAFEQGLVAAAVVVGDAANDLAALAVEAVERQRDAGAGLAMCGIEYMWVSRPIAAFSFECGAIRFDAVYGGFDLWDRLCFYKQYTNPVIV